MVEVQLVARAHGRGAVTDTPTGCHRSPHAWALQLTKYAAKIYVSAPSREYLIACSGAKSESLDHSFKGQEEQDVALSRLSPKPTLITITMGGNDLGVSGVLKDCYLLDCAKAIADVKARLPKEEKTLQDDDIKVGKGDPGATIWLSGTRSSLLA